MTMIQSTLTVAYAEQTSNNPPLTAAWPGICLEAPALCQGPTEGSSWGMFQRLCPGNFCLPGVPPKSCLQSILWRAVTRNQPDFLDPKIFPCDDDFDDATSVTQTRINARTRATEQRKEEAESLN